MIVVAHLSRNSTSPHPEVSGFAVIFIFNFLFKSQSLDIITFIVTVNLCALDFPVWFFLVLTLQHAIVFSLVLLLFNRHENLSFCRWSQLLSLLSLTFFLQIFFLIGLVAVNGLDFFEHWNEARLSQQSAYPLFFYTTWLSTMTTSKLHEMTFTSYGEVVFQRFVLIMLDFQQKAKLFLLKL